MPIFLRASYHSLLSPCHKVVNQATELQATLGSRHTARREGLGKTTILCFDYGRVRLRRAGHNETGECHGRAPAAGRGEQEGIVSR